MHQTRNSTVIEAIVDLQRRGYSLDFIIMDDKLFCAQQKIYLQQEEFDVSELYSFHHNDSQGETIVYGIDAPQYAIKGILLSQPKQYASAVPPILFKKMGKFWV